MNDDPQLTRARTTEPGDIVFIYRQEHDDFQFCNIEDVTETGFRVSFQRPRRQRRNPAIDVAFNDVVLPAELNGRQLTQGYTFGANEVVIKTTGSDTAEAFALIAAQEEPNHPMLVAKVANRSDAGWTLVGDPFIVQPEDIYHPLSLNLLQRVRFLWPVHPLFDILRQEAGLNLELEQPGILKLPAADLEIPVGVNLRVNGHVINIELSAHYTIASLLGNAKSEFLTDEELLPREQAQPQWSALVAVNGTTQHSGAQGFSASVSIIPRQTTFIHKTQPTVATTETYIGAPFNAWCDLVSFRDGQINLLLLSLKQPPSRNAVFFSCFGKPAIIYAPTTHEGVEHEYLSVTRIGEPLEAADLSVLSTFIGYITGGRARNVLTETFSFEDKLKTVIHDRGEPTKRKQPPIPIKNAWLHANLVTKDFTSMLNELKRLRGVDHQSFDAVFHHYAEGVDSNYPVTRTLRLAIAFEAFVNLVTQDKAENENILEGDDYKPLRAKIQDTIKTYADGNRAKVTDDVEKRYINKFDGFNTGSNTKRIKRFWELVPIELENDDQEFIRKLRNQSAHQGFLGEADEEQDPLGDAADADRLTDIINRAILSYIKYTGPVLSAIDGRWLDAKTGALFKAPPKRHGGTLEIRHQVTLPMSTQDEQATAERLREMQREPAPDFPFAVDDATPGDGTKQ